MNQDQSSTDNVSDKVLVRRAVAGDVEAFGDLYERYLTAVYRYLFYRVRDQAQAEDLSETVFLKAWEALDRFEWRGKPFLAWLYRIAHNLVVDYYREEKAPTVELESQPQLASPLSSFGARPEEEVSLNLQIEEVLEALTRLDETQQEVIILRLVMGMSHDETADILERSPGSVRVIQHRALRTLRAWLNG